MSVRTRFAPSPTGFLHVGGVRTALFAWLVAKQGNGQFILRLEDTDKAREVEGSDLHIMQSLKWLGLDWDEGPDKTGKYGPYRQSQRLAIYKEWSQKLLDAQLAYADPYSSQEVQDFREQAQKEKKPFLYRNHRPDKPPIWDGSQPLRFKSTPKTYKWNDAVMGELSAGPETIDDFILIKSDGYPTYNFCHIVDDHLMKISHVIRSQEFLASVPKYLNLYEALEIKPPILATLPFVMGPSGNKKLSKRDGAKDILDYKKQGFLPETLINFLATLGWNDGTEQEIFSLEDLLKKFSLDRVHKSGAVFDEKRLTWMNGHYIRELDQETLVKLSEEFWPQQAKTAEASYKKRILELVQERLKFFSELSELTSFFFEEPDPGKVMALYSSPVDKQLKSLELNDYLALLKPVGDELSSSDFSETDITKRLNHLLETQNSRPGILFSVIRIAITGSASSPQLFGTLAVLGKEKSLDRLRKTIQRLEKSISTDTIGR